MFVRLNNKYTLPGNIEWRTRLSYSGPRIDAVNRREGVFSSNMAFSKDLFNEKASISLNINDLLNLIIAGDLVVLMQCNVFNYLIYSIVAFNLYMTWTCTTNSHISKPMVLVFYMNFGWELIKQSIDLVL